MKAVRTQIELKKNQMGRETHLFFLFCLCWYNFFF